MHLITLSPWSEKDILETVEDSLNIKKYPEKYRHAVGGKKPLSAVPKNLHADALRR